MIIRSTIDVFVAAMFRYFATLPPFILLFFIAQILVDSDCDIIFLRPIAQTALLLLALIINYYDTATIVSSNGTVVFLVVYFGLSMSKTVVND